MSNTSQAVSIVSQVNGYMRFPKHGKKNKSEALRALRSKGRQIKKGHKAVLIETEDYHGNQVFRFFERPAALTDSSFIRKLVAPRAES